MRKLVVFGALLLAGCGPTAYDDARQQYATCLANVSPAGDCTRYQQAYQLARDDAQVRQGAQASSASWAQWYMNSQRVTTCTRLGNMLSCQ